LDDDNKPLSPHLRSVVCILALSLSAAAAVALVQFAEKALIMDNSTSPSEPTLLPGQSPPLTVITPTDQGGIVIIATALALIFALISVLLRVFVRVEFRNRFFGDDVAALLSMASLLTLARLL
jgi:hypothetical protein